MQSVVIGIVGIVMVLAVLRLLRGGAQVMNWTEHAAHTGDLQLLIEKIESNTDGDEGTAWDQAIGALWEAFHRETATRLVVEAATRSDAPILQYWIKRVLEVEPELAEAHFSQEFLARHFRPEVAAKCGRSCGCG